MAVGGVGGGLSGLVLRPVGGSETTARTLWICSGQGTQIAGMGKKLYDASEVFQGAIHEANDAFRADLAAMGEVDTTLMKVMFEGDGLQRTQRTQAALVAGSMALARFAKSEGLGLRPGDLVAGHSVGEWSAYGVAGGLSLRDAVRAVHWRGFFMEKIPIPGEGSMMVALIDDHALEKLDMIRGVCGAVMAEHEGWVVNPANVNAPEQVAVAGHPAAVAEVAKRLSGRVARVVPVNVVRPFHTPLMGPAKRELAEKLDQLEIKVLLPEDSGVIANLTGRRLAAGADPMQIILDQIDSTVLWAQSMRHARELGVTAVVVLAIGSDIFWNFNKANFTGNDAPPMFDPQHALHRSYLRMPPGMVRTFEPVPTPAEADRRLLEDSYAAGAVYRRVVQLAEAGDFQTALRVLSNPLRVVREAGLRALEPHKDRPEVAAAMAASGFAWPAPVVRDLPTVTLDDKTVDELRTLYGKLDKLAVAPIELEELVYYVASRWKGNPGTLALIMKFLNYLAGQESAKLKLLRWGPTMDETGTRIPDIRREQGVDEWEKVILWLDPQIKFSPLGAMQQEDL